MNTERMLPLLRFSRLKAKSAPTSGPNAPSIITGKVKNDKSLSATGMILKLANTKGVQSTHDQTNVIKKKR